MRTNAFLGVVAAVFLLVPANRSSWLRGSGLRLRNRWFALLVIAVVSVLALALAHPWLRQVLGFAPPAAAMLGAVALVALPIALWLGLFRLARPRTAAA